MDSKSRKYNFIILLIVLLCPYLKIIAQDEFQIVQSVPDETVLEQSTLPRTLDVWLDMINGAMKTIDIETFYFANQKGKPLEKVMNALKNAAVRGVRIRIIVDSSFYANNDQSLDELNEINNIAIKKIPMANISGGVMHAKYFIVDNENLFIGSQNMDWRALIHIHEVGARVRNKDIAKTFTAVFDTDWKLADENSYSITNQLLNYLINAENPVTVNSKRYGDIVLYPAFSNSKINISGLSSEENELFKIIRAAKKRLFIQMYSYSPRSRNEGKSYLRIDSALRAAAGRGVKIKIIFPDWAIRDVATDFIKELSTVKNIKIKFCTIPPHSGGFIPYSRVDHSKYFIADKNISWISTSNWEQGYFYNSRNATLIVNNEKVNEDLSEIFYKNWNGPYTKLIDVDKKYEPVKRY